MLEMLGYQDVGFHVYLKSWGSLLTRSPSLPRLPPPRSLLIGRSANHATAEFACATLEAAYCNSMLLAIQRRARSFCWTLAQSPFWAVCVKSGASSGGQDLYSSGGGLVEVVASDFCFLVCHCHRGGQVDAQTRPFGGAVFWIFAITNNSNNFRKFNAMSGEPGWRSTASIMNPQGMEKNCKPDPLLRVLARDPPCPILCRPRISSL